MHPIKHLTHHKNTTDSIVVRTALHHNSKGVTGVFIREKSNHPRIDILFTGIDLGGTSLSGNRNVPDVETTHGTAIVYRITHPLSRNLEVLLRNSYL